MDWSDSFVPILLSIKLRLFPEWLDPSEVRQEVLAWRGRLPRGTFAPLGSRAVLLVPAREKVAGAC
jgi:hypothetical protein